ncbi:MAG: murein hydrolase activator EnvC family protein [Clostridium sp.]
MKNIKNKIIVLLCVVMFSVSYIPVWAESSDAIKDKIEANKDAIDKIDKETQEIKDKKAIHDSELNSLFEKIDEKGKELREAEKDVEVFQVKIDKLQEDINVIQQSIDSAEAEILETQNLITKKEEEVVKTQAMLGERLRSYYKMNISSQFLYMIIKSEGLGELLGNIQSITRVITIDRDLMDSIKKSQKELLVEKNSLDKRVAKDKVDKENLTSKQSEIFEAQKEFVVIKDAKQAQMDELLALETEKANTIAALTKEEQDLQHKIGDLVAYNKDLQNELQAIFDSIQSGNNGSGNGNGNGSSGGDSGQDNGEGFLRPTNGPITDPYGPRINPVTGEKGMHNGVDFGDPFYTPIKATKSGVVTYAGWISGYGNSIIIDHGGGVTSLYGHADSLSVSLNQKVSRGQTVALVGSTGMSTGPHLHFEIRINGQPVNPMNYV